MTCEFCGQSRMDVTTYEMKLIIKYTACVPCCRIIDNYAHSIKEKYETKLKQYICNLIESRRKIEEAKK